MDILSLPFDLFCLVVLNLEPSDWAACIRVSKSWRSGFSENQIVLELLKLHFPRAREVRRLQKQIIEQDNKRNNCYSSKSPEPPPNSIFEIPGNPGEPGSDARTRNIAEEEKLSDTLSKVARRYHHLRSGTPYQIEKFEPIWSGRGGWRYYPVAPWDRHLELDKSQIPFHYPDSLWAYDNGLLVFPSRELDDYVIVDLESRKWSYVVFPGTAKIVRRLSFRDRVLLLEWAEAVPKEPHAHFATFYDVLPSTEAGKWIIQFRNEIKLHPEGLPLDQRGRFFSVHSKTHYAVYIWRQYPMRGLDDHDYNDEAFTIYDISTPCMFRPSEEDPTAAVECNSMNNPAAQVGSPAIKILDRNGLAFYGILWDDAPKLTALHIDELNLYVVAEDHFLMAGPHASVTRRSRSHSLQTTSIPLGYGPHFIDQCGIGPDDLGMNLCSDITMGRELQKVPCWRHEEFPSLTLAEAWDEGAGVRFRATRCFLFTSLDVFVAPRVVVRIREQKAVCKRRNAFCAGSLREEWKREMWKRLGFVEVRMDGMWKELLGRSGKIEGDERWIVGDDEEGKIVVCRFN